MAGCYERSRSREVTGDAAGGCFVVVGAGGEDRCAEDQTIEGGSFHMQGFVSVDNILGPTVALV